MKKIYVDPSKIWDFFQQNKKDLLENMIPVAEDKASDTVIYITNVQGFMCLTVYLNDTHVYDESFQSKSDAEEGAEYFYYSFLTEKDEGDEDDVIESETELREQDIHIAFLDFLEAILDPMDLMLLDEDVEMLEEVKTEVLELLGECGFMIYRPTICYDTEDGSPRTVNYPYRSCGHSY